MRNNYLEGKLVRTLLLVALVSGGAEAFAQRDTTGSGAADTVQPAPNTIYLLHKKQPAGQLLQSTATITTGQLTTTPAPSFLQALPGRLSGLYTRQRSGIQDADNPTGVVDFKIRGQNPLILIDGVPRDFSSIEPESIQSVTILKDALASVMYGQRSANNIILVTTQRPIVSPFKLSATAQHGIQSLINLPKPVSSADYAVLYNEARNNDGLAPVYSAADILAYRNGSDPLGHPNNNYQDLFLNKNASLDRYNVNIRSGSDIARFYVALDYQKEGGFFKTRDINTYSTNTSVDRYIVRSNVEVNLNKTLTVGLNVFGRIQDAIQPGATASDVYTAIVNTPGNAYSIFNDNNSLGGNSRYSQNISGMINNSGYYKGTTRDLASDLEVTQKLGKLAPGMWLKANISYNNTVDQTVDRSKSFAVFNLTNPGGATPVYSQIGTNGAQPNTFSFNSRRTYTYGKFSVGYDKAIGAHKISAQALADRQATTLNLNLPAIYTNFAGNGSYSFADKYFAEAAVSYGGLNRYKPGKRFGFFYAGGLGWNIAREDFLNGVSWISSLKPRISYGRTANANVDYFIYDQYYAYGGTSAAYYFGASPTVARYYTELALANPNATWEKANKLNVAIDASFFKDRLSITSEYFNDMYFDQMQTRGRSTSLIGQTFPAENIGKNRFSGFDNSITWNSKAGSVSYFVTGNGSLLKSKVLYQDEVVRQYDYQRRTGLPVGQTFGYVANGFFQSQADIAASPKIDGYTSVPGDIKYVDLNNDGVVNTLDQTAIGTQKPLLFYGVTTGLSVKGFDLSISIQGVANRDVYLSGSLEYGFQSGNLITAYEHQLNRWTPANAANATYPRLAVGANSNQLTSSFWIHSASYLRLQNVDLGYTLPAKFSSKFKLEGIRIFANGFNLYSFNTLDHTDPENSSAVYPIRKTFNAGLNIRL